MQSLPAEKPHTHSQCTNDEVQQPQGATLQSTETEGRGGVEGQPGEILPTTSGADTEEGWSDWKFIDTEGDDKVKGDTEGSDTEEGDTDGDDAEEGDTEEGDKVKADTEAGGTKEDDTEEGDTKEEDTKGGDKVKGEYAKPSYEWKWG